LVDNRIGERPLRALQAITASKAMDDEGSRERRCPQIDFQPVNAGGANESN